MAPQPGLVLAVNRPAQREIRANQAAKQTAEIHKWLTAYALDAGGAYPTGDTANLAYRELFKKDIGADENQFYIPNDPYHKSARGQKPDGDIGSQPEYMAANAMYEITSR